MRSIVGVFAHPDDEVFTGGTLATFAKERDVYLVCMTNGEAGINSSSNSRELGDLRKDELRESAQALGVKDVLFLNFGDGELKNNQYGALADSLREVLEKYDPEIVITFESRGVSGHVDHAITSMVTSYVFESMPTIKELWYYVFNEYGRKLFKEYFKEFFVFTPPGYKEADITRVIDTSAVWEKKIAAMHAHDSQKHDMEKLIEIFEKQQKNEYFSILTRENL